MGSARTWRLGLIGAGNFGKFCLEQFRGWGRVEATAVSDAAPEAARAAAGAFGLAFSETPEALLRRDDVDVVLISTPPNTHYELTRRALEAGKHVVCEKPLALTAAEAEDAVRAARAAGLRLAVNHMLRYSPLLEVVKALVDARLLGEPRHAFFENYAGDEQLGPEHWFWDRARSGGLFVEHAVHFFDLHHWWFGRGEMLAAHVEERPETRQADRVWCQTRYEGAVLVGQYHGFDQAKRMDRADHRVVLERGQVVVQGWVPMQLSLMGIVDEETRARVTDVCDQCQVEVVDRYQGAQQDGQGGGRPFHVTAQVRLTRELTEPRGWVYGEMLRRLLDDQLRSLEDPTHVPRLQPEDAAYAVTLAEAAVRMAAER